MTRRCAPSRRESCDAACPAASAAYRATEVHAAAEPVLTELIAMADITTGETVMATGLDR